MTATLCLSALLATSCATAPPSRHLDVTAFDVGYGAAVLVEAEGTRLLFDTGPPETGKQLARSLARGGKSLELVVLSHPHPDHAGGLAAIVKRGPAPQRMWRNPDPAWENDAEEVTAGRREQIGPFTLTVLHPADGSAPDANDRSLVVLVEWRGRVLLFPGDVVSPALQEHICAQLPSRIDVLELPHHGDIVAPCLAERADTLLLSVGPNPWGMPRPETITAWRTKIRRTGKPGEVHLRFREAAGP